MQNDRHFPSILENDRHFRLLAETASDAIVVVDTSSTILFVNQAAERIFGYQEEEMQGAPLTLLMPEYLRHVHEAGLGRYLSTGTKHLDWSRIQLPGLHKDGHEITLEVSFGESVEDGLHLFTGIIRDVTEQQRLAEALHRAHVELEERVEARTAELREREQQLRDLFESSPDAVFVEDVHGYVLDVNPAACEFHGLTRDELVGMHVSALVPPDERERVRQEFASFATGERTRQESVSWVEGRGAVPVEISTRPITYRSQPAVLLHVRDMSERKRIEQARQEELVFTHAVLESITDAVVACDAHGRLTVFNRAARELHGLQEQPLAADAWAQRYNLQHPDGKPMKPTEIPLYRAWQGERVTNIPVQIASPTLGTRLVIASGQPVLSSDGHVLGAVVALHDATEQEQARKLADKAHLQLVEAIETLSEGFVLYDREDRLVICNDKYREVYAASAPIEAGMTFEQLLRRGVERGQYQEAIGREEAFIRERLEQHRNPPGIPIEQELGNGRWLRILERRTRDGGIVGIRTDITELKRREAALSELNRELEAFSYSVSHDLRAPLRGVTGFSQALLEEHAEQLDESGRHYLARIQSAAERMGELIDDLLELSRLSRKPVNPTRVDLSELAREVMQRLKEREPERTVEVSIADGLVVRGDERLLRIALENLFENAWKFTRHQPQARITFVSASSEHDVVYVVRDNGAGFDMTYANKLFVPFQRLHHLSEFEGTGIGLVTVQRIIHRHGGRIWAEGEEGKGATFYFTLGTARQ